MSEEKVMPSDVQEPSEVEETEVLEEANDVQEAPPCYQMTLEEFIKENKPHAGLVASFKVEEKNLEPRSQTTWEEAFKAQSKRIYK